MSELKPCPFCGPHDYFKPEMVPNGSWHHDIVCSQCGARTWCEMWERRPIEDALRAEVAALEEELHQVRMNWDAALKAELKKYTEPLTDEQAEMVIPRDPEIAMFHDAAIRRVRGSK